MSLQWHATTAAGMLLLALVAMGKVFLSCFPDTSLVNTIGFVSVLLMMCTIAAIDFINGKQNTRLNGSRDRSDMPCISLNQLSNHNGVTLDSVYCSVKGRVYDVSTSGSIMPGGSYSVLCGVDATVAMGKMSLDRKYLNSTNFDGLEEGEWDIVHSWVEYMDRKYPCVALVNEYMCWAGISYECELASSRSHARHISEVLAECSRADEQVEH